MTRASLLQILDHVTRISPGEVRELEQLAAAFPYCQTAHLLLAKAAHDQGSMLASQRLRHAATYAADRELLRRLIETTAEPALVDAPAAALVAAVPAESQSEPISTLHEEAAVAELTTVEVSAGVAEPTVLPEVEPAEARTESVAPTTAPEVELVDVTETHPLPEPAAGEVTAESYPAVSSSTEGTSLPAEEALAPLSVEALTEQPDLQPEAEAADEAPLLAAEEPATEEAPAASLIGPDAAAPEIPEDAVETTNQEEAIASLPVAESAEIIPVPALLIPDDLPALPPPIRPPADAGSSRFEYGFEEPEPAAPPIVYELPEAEDENTARTMPAFYADAAVGYGLAGGSRLGYALEPSEALARPLPLDTFFEPDALLLAYAETHRPAPLPTSIDLINRFLKNKPRLKSPATLPPPTDEQADLSVRSTRSVPELASESLAKIMVRQGKVAKAIEIYERLMVRQPEKKAYFADQIQHLKLTE
ncbi:hypothetical protein [Hymenobacter guriensis]|uniref:Tetratricopeptide repeat protein n=1 Tax=Hymenobacter guriensis TaxID=2793065 RepID=A0ABS0L3T7_9BACT|nr:hypothetical protein [Hymenobacter guriensis]MBG8554042.1 hypothetical protein [Hymenobacter guriensis]